MSNCYLCGKKFDGKELLAEIVVHKKPTNIFNWLSFNLSAKFDEFVCFNCLEKGLVFKDASLYQANNFSVDKDILEKNVFMGAKK